MNRGMGEGKRDTDRKGGGIYGRRGERRAEAGKEVGEVVHESREERVSKALPQAKELCGRQGPNTHRLGKHFHISAI